METNKKKQNSLFSNWNFTGGLIAVFSGIIYYYPIVFYIFLFIIYSILIILVTIAGTVWLLSKNRAQASHLPKNELYNATCSSLFDPPKPIANASNLPIIFGRTVDGVLQQIIEYILRDFISPWLCWVVRKPKILTLVLREHLWTAVQKLRERCVKVDAPKVISVDMVIRTTVHLEKIRIAKARALESGKPLVFSTTSYLISEEKELEFLRKISEIMVIFLLPKGYSLSPLKNLISEILAYKILYPSIQMITSPDYLNQKLVQYIESRLAAAAIKKRTCDYAACFEDFVKIISNSTSIDELLMIRTSIINDVLQATTMQNGQRAKGVDPDQEENSIRSNKTEMNMAIKLKRYLQQLSYAKSQCEKSLIKLGWTADFNNDLSLSEILANLVCRRYFILFLESLKANNLLSFYMSVEELKTAPRSAWHQLGAEIFYTYVRAPNSEVIADKTVRKQMEAFLLGDCPVDVFYEAQKSVFMILEEKYYPHFLMSDQYRELKDAMSAEEGKEMIEEGGANGDGDEPHSFEEITVGDVSMELTNHSSYARSKLEKIQERLDNKDHALQALKMSMKPESKVLSILEKEVEWLRGEKRQLEAHLMRTEVWGENLGKWQATIQNVEFAEDKEPQFIILVQTDENGKQQQQQMTDEKDDDGNISTGWVVLRTLSQFHDVHRKLRPLCPEIRTMELPSTTFKMFFLKNDKASLDRVKVQVQKYLNFILEDDYINQSEALYNFLNPSSEHLKHETPSPKKNKFSITGLFNRNETREQTFWGPPRDGEDNMSQYLEANNKPAGEESTNVNNGGVGGGGVVKGEKVPVNGINNNNSNPSDDGKDSIAEPLYGLMGEIFEMDGVFKWVRKSMISFVQITYGRTINRQIRESINALFDESMLHHYSTSAMTSFWPGGVLAAAYPERSVELQEQTAVTAKSMLVENIPELFSNLVGQQTAKVGALKVFDAIQDPLFNKQLFYELMEILLIELFPEIRQLKPKQKPLPTMQRIIKD